MYRKSTWWSADKSVCIIKKYHAANCLPENEKTRQRRKPKGNATSEEQEEINYWQRTEKLQRLMLDNFRAGDWYLTLTYGTGKLPQTEQQAKKDFEKFKRKLRGFYKEKQACKFISIMENINNGRRLHMHIMVTALPAEMMAKVQRSWPHGKVKFEIYRGKLEDAFNVAGYFTKQTREKTTGVISTSRNLLRTVPRYETILKADTYSDKPKAPAGYEIVQKLSGPRTTKTGFSMLKTVLERKDYG